MASEGATGFCSERCLMWDFFGVPALEVDDMISEIRENQRRQSVSAGWESAPAYPAFKGGWWKEEVREALALLRITCNDIRSFRRESADHA